mgnify:CR=1 FL=1
MAVSYQIDGLNNAVKALTGLPRKIRNKSLRKAFAKGATVCAKAVRRNTERDTGTAKKNVGTKTVVRGDQDPVAIIGHRNKLVIVNGKRKNPSRYSHLMEGGAKAHAIIPRRGKSLKFGVGRGNNAKSVFARRVSHPGAPPQRVIRQSFVESKGPAVATIVTSLRDSIPGDVR